jgi:REP element-mobilizing transposase RayT
MMLHRRSIRLQHYNYSQAGAYFVTICAHARECLFGEIIDGAMILSNYGKIVEECWNNIESHFDDVELDSFVIMPNHIHGIITFVGAGSPRPDEKLKSASKGAETAPLPKRRTLGNVVAYFKYQSTKRLNLKRNTPSFAVWQRNYYEHIVRDEIDLNRIRGYIQHNPARWAEDENNPKRVK